MESMIMEFNNNFYEKYILSRRRTMSKPTKRQIECLIDFMERHPDLVNDVAENRDSLWLTLTTLLNSVKDDQEQEQGCENDKKEVKGAIKTTQGWKRTWADLIGTARQSMKFMLNGSKSTPLSQHHIRVIDLVGYREEPSPCVEWSGTHQLPSTRRLYGSSMSCAMPNMNEPMQSTMQHVLSLSSYTPSLNQPMGRKQPAPTSSSSSPRLNQHMQNTIQPVLSSSSYTRNLDLPMGNITQPAPSSSSYAPSLNQRMQSTMQHVPNSNSYMPSIPLYMPSTSHQMPSRSRQMPMINQPMSRTMEQMLNTHYSMDGDSYQHNQGSSVPEHHLRLPNSIPKKFKGASCNIPKPGTILATTGTTLTATSATAADKTSKFLQAFEDKGAEIVLTLANQLITCFEKQEETIKNSLQALTESLKQNIPRIVAEEFKKISAATENAESQEHEEEVQQIGTNDATEETEEVFVTSITNPEICTICLSEICDYGEKLECNHEFCKACIESWLKEKKVCPICRFRVRSDSASNADNTDNWSWDTVAVDSDED